MLFVSDAVLVPAVSLVVLGGCRGPEVRNRSTCRLRGRQHMIVVSAGALLRAAGTWVAQDNYGNVGSCGERLLRLVDMGIQRPGIQRPGKQLRSFLWSPVGQCTPSMAQL